MLATLISWLNGTREFNTGAALYKHLGKDEKLKVLFAQGKTLYSNFRLQEELRLICKSLKAEKNAKLKNTPAKPGNISTPSTSTAEPNKTSNKAAGSRRGKEKTPGDNGSAITEDTNRGGDELIEAIVTQVNAIAKAISPPNPELYKACKHEADMEYKQAMNTRALLFAMVPANKFEDPNRPDLVASRKGLALAAARQYNHASELYDRADYVKLNGRLPDQEADNIDEEVANLENHEVKPALDNARKAMSKLKGREQTAERIALIQKHELKIKALEARWLSLKQKN